jgi:hypothetical protein
MLHEELLALLQRESLEALKMCCPPSANALTKKKIRKKIFGKEKMKQAIHECSQHHDPRENLSQATKNRGCSFFEEK